MPRKGKGGTGSHRGRGEGTVFQRAQDGKWVAQLSLPDGHRKSYLADTKADALARLRMAHRDREAGVSLRAETQTVGEYLTAWLETIKPPLRSHNTYANYERDTRLHLLPALGKVALARLSAQQVQRLYADKLAAGMDPGTVRHIHATLTVALKAAVRQGLLARNVAEFAEKPKPTRKERTTWTTEQMQRFHESVLGDRLEALYLVALATGMRESELLGMVWRNVTLAGLPGGRGAIRVLTQLQRRGDLDVGYALSAPKTEAGRRTIPIPPITVRALVAHRQQQEQDRAALGPAWPNTGLVFTNAAGAPLHRHALYNQFQLRVRRADLPHIRFHDLRHTAATNWLEAGFPVHVVARMLGHSNVATTMRVYAHVTAGMLDDLAGAMEGWLALPAPAAVDAIDAVAVREVPDD